MLEKPVGSPGGEPAALAEAPSQGQMSNPLACQESSILGFSVRLEEIIAEALQCSCDRDVPGAMEIFEEASASMECVAGLLNDLRRRTSMQAPGRTSGDTAALVAKEP